MIKQEDLKQYEVYKIKSADGKKIVPVILITSNDVINKVSYYNVIPILPDIRQGVSLFDYKLENYSYNNFENLYVCCNRIHFIDITRFICKADTSLSKKDIQYISNLIKLSICNDILTDYSVEKDLGNEIKILKKELNKYTNKCKQYEKTIELIKHIIQ